MSALKLRPDGNFSRAELLFDLLVEVVKRYEPEVAAVLREERDTAGMPAVLLARTLQAQGIWFQLLAIAEQNRDMRNRRERERELGYGQLRGTFAGVFATAAREGISAAEVREVLGSLRVRPVITAHPTEAKRVTVMERHRRIYLKLLELESPRWTDRERDELIQTLRDEIELLWLTGELKLEKPTVEQEVAWGLYFFNENLFDVVPQMLAKVHSAFVKQFPGRAARRADVLPVRLVDRRGPGRKSLCDQRGHAAHALADAPGKSRALPGPTVGAVARGEHRGSCAAAARLVPCGREGGHSQPARRRGARGA